METSVITWTFLGIIFFLFLISSIILIANSNSRSSDENSALLKNSSSNKNYWKAVKGTIQQSSIDYRKHKPFMRSPVKQYCTRISYSYFAYDKEYSNIVTVNNWTPDKEAAKKILQQNQQGDAIIVRFDPKSPEISLVEINR